jgi:type 1 glutamine amidotransferase
LANPAPRVLVFTKTQGWRHDNIPAGIEAFRAIGQARGFQTSFSEDGTIFSDATLRNIDVVVFLNTTGDILNRDQEAAFERWYRSGGGVVGFHAATDTEYEWPFYAELLGTHFKNHPPGLHNARVITETFGHPTTSFLPPVWNFRDEWYNFRTNPRGKVFVLQSLDTQSYQGSSMPDDHPIAWFNEIHGGRVWYTGLGHTQEMFRDPLVLRYLAEGVLWTAQAKSLSNPVSAWKGSLTRRQNGEWVGSGARKDWLQTTEPVGSALIHVEFKVSEGASAVMLLNERYGIRLGDSARREGVSAADLGGIESVDRTPGAAPLVNASRPAGTWQTLDVLFEAPLAGRRKARIAELRINGVVVQKKVEFTGPTASSKVRTEEGQGLLRFEVTGGDLTVGRVSIRPLAQ